MPKSLTRPNFFCSRDVLLRIRGTANSIREAHGASTTECYNAKRVVEGGNVHDLPETGSLARGVVMSAEMISPTTRALKFLIQTEPQHLKAQQFGSDSERTPQPADAGGFAFRPGQWADCLIPHCEEIGGFSMTSSPLELPHLSFAVKDSDHAAAKAAVHSAQVGDEWLFRVGGHLCLPSEIDPDSTLVFIAGGIGITPLYSMAHHLALNRTLPRKTIFIHTSKSADELLFKKELTKIAGQYPKRFSYLPWVSDDQGLLQDENIAEVLSGVDVENAFCYLCGPTHFAPDLKSIISSLGVPKAHIYGEKWW